MSSINNVFDARHSSTSSGPRLTLAQTVYQPWVSPSTRPGQQMRRTFYLMSASENYEYNSNCLNTLRNTIFISATTVFHQIRLILIITNQTL